MKRIRCLRRKSANGALYLSCDDLVLACRDSPETRILKHQLARSALSQCESSPRTIQWVCRHGEGYRANVKSNGIYPFPARCLLQKMGHSGYEGELLFIIRAREPEPRGLVREIHAPLLKVGKPVPSRQGRNGPNQIRRCMMCSI